MPTSPETVATALMEELVATVAMPVSNAYTHRNLLILNTTLLTVVAAQYRCAMLAVQAVRQATVETAAMEVTHTVTLILRELMVSKVAQVVMLVMAELLAMAVMAVSNILMPTNKL